MASFAARIRRAFRLLRQERLRDEPLFDTDFYRWAHDDAPLTARGARWHYAVLGGAERVPSPDFDARRYVARTPDVLGSGLSPLVHYVRFGREEGREIRPHYTRWFVDDAGTLDRDALESFLRSGALVSGPGSVLRALPHLLHAMPRETATAFGPILVALASGDAAALAAIAANPAGGAATAAGPGAASRPTLDGVGVVITDPEPGDGSATLVAASLAALAVGGEVARDRIALPGEPAPETDVLVEVVAGALVVPGSLARLAEHARHARGATVVGAALEPDGVPLLRWDGADVVGPAILSARVTAEAAPSGEPEPAIVRGATAVWWPPVTPEPRADPRPVAIVMDAAVPTPDLDSGSLCSVSYARTLVALGYRVLFVPEDLRHHPRYTRELESWGIEVVDERWATSLDRVFAAVPAELAVLIRFPVFQSVHRRLLRARPGVRVLFAPLDLHHVRMAAQAAVSGDAALAAEVDAVRELERSHIEAADATLVLSSLEVEQVRALAPGATVELVPMARERTAARGIQRWDDRHDVIFLGSYTHAPNLDAVHWFLDEIWPDVAARLPDARFVAYGSSMPPELRARASDRIVMHGYVEHLDDAFATARLGVVPLRFGAGVKGKVTSTLLAGVPVVTTPVGIEGMDLDGSAVLIADGASAFADAIVAAWHDEPRLTALSAAGLDAASTRFSFAAQRAALAALLTRLGLPAEPGPRVR